ncbi:DUF805 domain-containing protein [Demequina activiva]|uniref:DUF805 domain-containing protein n=1 Tax=Demequina activiva TaxID=1582364 RepID=A0A919UKV1_9MICO|nr:DUF805 domain-containing protein [Demequina activiva]GIG54073.1 DUF805 domain-containing protein [Demequina activiva]
MTVGWFFKALTQYADFHQRARRREFWWFVATAYAVQVILVGFTLVTLNNAWDGSTLDADEAGISTWIMGIGTMAVSLLLVVPYWAVTVRRLHDTDHSGWWALFLLFFPLLIWIFACFDGTPAPNRYGPDPKELERPGVA